ncbi:MAG: Uncharacterized MFS-type transporter, partial [uncultured Rubrobacteraceae bacterium]
AEGGWRAVLLRLGRGRGGLSGAPRLGGGARGPGGAHQPSRDGARLEPGCDLLRRLHRPSPLRPLGSRGRLAHGPLRPDEGRALRPRRDRGQHPGRRRHDRALAAQPVLGRPQRHRHRRRRPRPRRDRREPLVYRAPRPRPRHPRGGGLRRTAPLRPGAHVARRRRRLARGDGLPRRRLTPRPRAGPTLHARRPGPHGATSLRRAGEERRRGEPGPRARDRRRGRRAREGGRGVETGREGAGVLAALGELLYLRGVVQRDHRGPLYPPLHRPRHPGGDGRGRPRAHGRDELRRDHRLGLPDGPLRPPQAPRRLLLPARPLATAAAVRRCVRGPRHLRRFLRARLHSDGAPDRGARRGQVRPGARGYGLRLGLLRPPAWRRPRRLPRRRRPRLPGRLHRSLPRGWHPGYSGRPHGEPREPLFAPPGRGSWRRL